MWLSRPLTFSAPIAISLGAIGGALSRYYITLWFVQKFGTVFPFGTYFVNLTGCLVMGFLATWLVERSPAVSPEIRLLLTTGFLGAYTTFSTYGLETVVLLRQQQLVGALLYWLGSAVFGVVSVFLGAFLARQMS